MTGILSGDIKLLASEVMDDVPEGGGAPTSTVILDGASNAIFRDISEVDRAGGVVNIAKVFASVQSDNTDSYIRANVIVAEPPSDPNVSVVIFEAQDFFEQRAAAASRMEAYLTASTLYNGYLFESHLAGQRSIQIFQRPGAKAPQPGETLCLTQDEGAANAVTQYVRIKNTTVETRQFVMNTTNVYSEFDVQITTCEITEKLRTAFTGSPASRFFEPIESAAKLRSTLVADATSYYGAMPLAAPVAIGDLSVDVESIYTQLVPSAQTEIPLIDRALTGDVLPMVATATAAITRSLTASVAPSARYVLPTGCWPASLVLSIGSASFTDDGLGNVLHAGATVGAISYQTGEIAFNGAAPTASGACTETYRPAAGVSMQAYTLSRAVTAVTRAYVWVIPLTPLPAPGTLSLAYMAQGNWYQIDDNGMGSVTGSDVAYGAGVINYVTGTLNVTLGALPDAGTEILVSWGTQQEFVPLTTASLAIVDPKIEFDMGEAATPGTFVLHWSAGGVSKTAMDNGSGTLTGDATGVIYYGSGAGYFRTSVLPDSAEITATYETGAGETFGAVIGGGATWTGTLPNAPHKPGSIVMDLLIAQDAASADGGGHVAVSSQLVPGIVRDDGSGGLILEGYGALTGASINYTTGAVILVVNYSSVTPVATYTTTSTAING